MGKEKRKRWQVGDIEKQLLTFDHKHYKHFPLININCKNYKLRQMSYVHSNNLAKEKSLQVVNSETQLLDLIIHIHHCSKSECRGSIIRMAT